MYGCGIRLFLNAKSLEHHEIRILSLSNVRSHKVHLCTISGGSSDQHPWTPARWRAQFLCVVAALILDGPVCSRLEPCYSTGEWLASVAGFS